MIAGLLFMATGCAAAPELAACQELAGVEPETDPLGLVVDDDWSYWNEYVGACVDRKRAMRRLAAGN